LKNNFRGEKAGNSPVLRNPISKARGKNQAGAEPRECHYPIMTFSCDIHFQKGCMGVCFLSMPAQRRARQDYTLGALPKVLAYIAFTETAAALSGGMYFLRIQAEDLVQTR
jgi:hypothetical protein